LQIASLADDHQTRGNRTLDCLLVGAELRLDREAGVGKQMLQALAEQAVGFDQDGADEVMVASPNALMLERPCDLDR
jgi:hypothetical protein